MNNKAMGLLGLAARARKIVSGEGVLTSIQNRSAKLVLIAEDASENTKKKYVDKCTYYNVEFDFVETSAELNQAMGTLNRRVIAVTDEGFAKNLHTCLKG